MVAFDLNDGDTIFIKGVNTRRSYDYKNDLDTIKLRFQKAKITGNIFRNTVPLTSKNRDTTVPLKDIKCPPQVRPAHVSHQDPGPSPENGA